MDLAQLYFTAPELTFGLLMDGPRAYLPDADVLTAPVTPWELPGVVAGLSGLPAARLARGASSTPARDGLPLIEGFGPALRDALAGLDGPGGLPALARRASGAGWDLYCWIG
ncbi:hypothetical protein Afil01_10710 [Actinorhabdospora filicis]|uniref:Uncharacterized protein n=1 Tax=Actinorhabdospora filicis TaxID=1785913 RepID=A0A9W6W775_9ACTN|nr:hypothetical protein [Actinorhabdospora filicis]GLZ76264.1 hypothetical protein Afil01_10710 [Actinorhabdospora filicis]